MFVSEPTSMPTFPEARLRTSDLKKAFSHSRLPLHARARTQSVLLLRILLRKHGIAEGIRRRAVETCGGPSLDHEKLDPSRLVEIPRVDALDLSPQILAEAIHCGVPVVLAGAARNSNAVKRWSPEYLGSRYGDVSLPMFREHSTSETMSVGECMQQIQDPAGDANIQINNVCSLFSERPELLEDLPIQDLASRVKGLRYHGANLFVCRGGYGSKYHCANELNFFCQIYGQKEWFFVHPRHAPQMDPLFTAPKGNYFASGVAWGQQPRGVPIGHALLQAGDILINPPWWWHWVRNPCTTIGVATRWLSWRHRFGTDNAYFSLLQWLFPHQWKILWQDYLRGGVLDEHKWVHADR